MQTRRVIVTAFAIAGVPLAVLVVLVAARALAVPTALAAAAPVIAAGLVFAFVWARDLDRLAEVVRRTAAGDPDPLSAAPALPEVERIGREIERLSRTLADRAALVGRMRRADEVIVERLPDPLIVLGADRAVRRANQAARTAYGPDMQALLRHPGLYGAIDRAFAQSTTQTTELTIPAPVLREVHAYVIFLDTPLADGGQAVVVLSDRTRERAIERMRADFVANASHELRTPLASLIGFIETLRGPAADDPPAQRRFLAIMAEQASRMSRLIDDLLSLSRIELTEHQSPKGSVDIAALLPRLAAGFEPRLKDKGMQLDMRVPERPLLVAGDADQLAQVVQNLLDNALKYGASGGGVRLSATRPEPGGRWPARPGILVAVADDGPGIPRRHLPRLTERFYRVDTGRSRAIGGTGLGLAIVKHIVNRHRGHLSIESEEGLGTTVAVWLPAAPDHQSPMEVSSGHEAEPA